MNRFRQSAVSLLLAVLFLFSAAGASLGVLFQSTQAYAAGPSSTDAPVQLETPDSQETPGSQEAPEGGQTASPWSPDDQKINIANPEEQPANREEPAAPPTQLPEEEPPSPPAEDDGTPELPSPPKPDAASQDRTSLPEKLEGHIDKATLNETDIKYISVPEQSGTLILTVSITNMTKEHLEDFLNNGNDSVGFNAGGIFVPNNGTGKFDPPAIDDIESVGSGGVSFQATMNNVQYIQTSNTKSVEFTFQFGQSTFSGEYPINISSDRPVISSVNFKSNVGTIYKVSPGTTGTLTIVIHDPRFQSEDDFDKYVEGMKPSLNVDAFSNGGEADIDFSRPVSGNSIEYTITFENITYRGLSNYLMLSPNYKGDYMIAGTLNYSLNGFELYEPEPDDNNDYEPPDDDDSGSSSSKPDIPPPTPNIIVSTYDYGGGNVTAAGSFTLNMTMMNTSKQVNVENIVMKLGVPEAFTLTSSSNTFYIERIAKRSSVERTVNLSVKPNAEAISHPIKVSFTYEVIINDERKQLTAEQEISIPVSQLDRFSLNPVEVPNEIYVGEDTSIEATFVNKGKSTIYNVTAEITGNIAQPGQRQFIGNVESGKEDSADFLISALEAGPISGEVVITYEDANMNVNELRSPFQATAMSYDMPLEPAPDIDAMNPGDMGMEELIQWYRKVPVWGWMAGGLVLVILLSFAAKAARRRRDLKLLEDGDEDF